MKTVHLTWWDLGNGSGLWRYARNGKPVRALYSSEAYMIQELCRLYPNLASGDLAGLQSYQVAQRLLGKGRKGIRVRPRDHRKSGGAIDRQRARVYRAEDRLPEMGRKHNMTEEETIEFAEAALRGAGRSRLWTVRCSKRMKEARPFRLEIELKYLGMDGQEKEGKAVGVIMPMKVGKSK